MRIVLLGLSVTSSWGNGHATNYRGLMRSLERRGHEVLFLERDVPWYAAHRDVDAPSASLYASVDDLRTHFEGDVRVADLVVVGSYVPDGVAVGEWVTDVAGGATAFYDIDTPVTAARLGRGECDYLTAELVPRFDLYLSFTGGPLLEQIARDYGARRARAFYCLVDPDAYHPAPACGRPAWGLGYLGTYSADRQPTLERLLLEPARRLPDERFVVAGPQYPKDIEWPPNVERIDHLPPPEHAAFYAAQRFTLNVTRAEMVSAGWSPSVRLFEAAACAVPVVSDWWAGLDTFFEPGSEILVAGGADDVVRILRGTHEEERRSIGRRARRRVLAEHTADRRAAELERAVQELAAVSA